MRGTAPDIWRHKAKRRGRGCAGDQQNLLRIVLTTTSRICWSVRRALKSGHPGIGLRVLKRFGTF
jgi:hypothetical protein